MITRIEKITVYVDSQEEAKKFWTEKMGFSVMYEQSIGPGVKWIEVSPGGENCTTLVLYLKAAMQKQNPDAIAHPAIIFASDDIEALWKNIKAGGVDVDTIQTLPFGKMFTFKDNDGNAYMVRG